MASLNKVTLIGRLGGDPKIAMTGSGKKVATLNVATSEVWKDKDSGERKERTEWSTVVIFNPNLAAIAEKYLHKGSNVYVEGSLQTRKYTDSNNVERSVTEVVLQAFGGNLILLDSKEAKESNSDFDKEWEEAGKKAEAKYADECLSDEIPF
ncbi:MAG: single-stranded DNA-binding protein [Clostridium sp.]|nr:single-stranded DNA-binding protein [Clostridium sp.]